MVNVNDALKPYAHMLKGWSKGMGSKPTAEQLHTVHMLGARPGKQALANAMALRDGGVTGSQIIMACGAQQLNKMRGFVTDGLVKWEAMPFTEAGHKVYRIALTAKGSAKVTKAEAKAAETPAEKPAKAKKAKGKGKAKVTKAKAGNDMPAESPEADADAGNAPLPVNDTGMGETAQVTA